MGCTGCGGGLAYRNQPVKAGLKQDSAKTTEQLEQSGIRSITVPKKSGVLITRPKPVLQGGGPGLPEEVAVALEVPQEKKGE